MAGTKNPIAVTENLEQRALFEEYVAMGEHRSLKKVLEISRRSWNTIQAWSVKFNWRVRAQERDKELMENISVETPRESVDRKKFALDIVNNILKDIAVLDENGKVIDTKVKAKNIFDIRTLIDIRAEILGEKDKSQKAGTTNIDKAVFIIKK